jgi:hypothetical protein
VVATQTVVDSSRFGNDRGAGISRLDKVKIKSGAWDLWKKGGELRCELA